MAERVHCSYEFGPFRLDPVKRQLIREGRTVPLARKTFDLLLMLIEGRGRVFTKKELIHALWQDVFVEEGNLAFQVSALRKALGEDGAHWIETAPKYGYRFTADVSELDPNLPFDIQRQPTADPAIHTPSGTRSWIDRISNIRYALPTFLIVVLTGVLAIDHFREIRVDERVVRFQISPPDRVMLWGIDSIALSPNGEQLLFIGANPDQRRQLWIRAVGSLTAIPLKGTEFADSAFWSPDNRSIAFFAAGKLKKLDLQSGSVQIICDSPSGPSSGTWNRDGVILFDTIRRREIYRLDVSTAPRVLKLVRELKPDESRHSAPVFLPDGRHYIYFVQGHTSEDTGIYVGSLDSQESKRLVHSFTNAVFAQLAQGSSYLLFTRDSELMAQSIDLKKLELVGSPFKVVDRVYIATASGMPRVEVSASLNGVVAYRTQETQASTELVWFDRGGNRIGRIGDAGDYSNPSLSPDEKKLIVSRADPRTFRRDLWLFNLGTDVSSRFTFGPDDEDFPVWSKDGTRVAFNVMHDGIASLYEKEVAGTSEPEPLLPRGKNGFDAASYVRSWSPDGKFLLLGSGQNTWILSERDGGTIGPYLMESPSLSPDGRWIAYTSGESGETEIYVQQFPPSGRKWQISTEGGAEPEWREDGRELYYISGDNLVAVGVRTDLATFEMLQARTLFRLQLDTRRRRRYQVASNGERFLANLSLQSSSITLAINWTRNLEH